ncbi:unnamed protein product, partial [Tenebrio molitor]
IVETRKNFEAHQQESRLVVILESGIVVYRKIYSAWANCVQLLKCSILSRHKPHSYHSYLITN